MDATPQRAAHHNGSSSDALGPETVGQQASGNGYRDIASSGHIRTESLPTLYRDESFWGMTSTQFLGAFNDNLFKQLMLLLALKVAIADRQPVAMFVFSAPFLLFSGFAGYLADRYSKQRIIVLSKVAEIAAMLLGLLGFLLYDWMGFTGLLVVLFLMGTQSAFFGPSKYGILPEMLRKSDLPRANGLILMTTFLAIIFGTAAAGLLSEWLVTERAPAVASVASAVASAPDAGLEMGSPSNIATNQLWLASLACVAIAVLGTLTSLLVRVVPAAAPRLKFTLSAFGVPADMRRMLGMDRPLLGALFASCVFWLVAGIIQPTVNSFGNRQLELKDAQTSLLAASVAIGIAAGAVLAGRVSRGKANFRVMQFGGWGLIVVLLVLATPGSRHGHLLGFTGSLYALILMGVFAGMYAIPLQVFMQSRPPDGQKGRMIAVMNQANWVAILLSAGAYWLFDRIVISLDWNRSPIFAMTALVMLPALLLYHPKNNDIDNTHDA